MASEDVLYTVIGFLGTMFIMKTFRAVRPSSAKNMSLIPSTECTSCKGR